MVKAEDILKLAKENNINQLRRDYNSNNSLFIAFLVAFIIQLVEGISSLISLDIRGAIIDLVASMLICFFVYVFVHHSQESYIALELRETGLYKSRNKALQFVVDELNTF